MRKFKLFIITIICMFMLTACSDKLTIGVVVSKEYIPETTEITFVPQIVKVGNVHVTIQKPVPTTTPETWVIYIQGKINGEEVIESYNVTEAVYNALKVGDDFSYKEYEALIDLGYIDE